MRRADIEVPNPAVAVNAWAGSACYPQGSFYPLSDGPSTWHRRITNPDFRPCSSCWNRSQARFCIYTLHLVSIQTERTFGRLRYSLGGDRPSQTARLALSVNNSFFVRVSNHQGRYPNGGSSDTDVPVSLPPAYPVHDHPKLNTRLQ